MTSITRPRGVTRRLQSVFKRVVALTGALGHLSCAVGRTGRTVTHAFVSSHPGTTSPTVLLGTLVAQPWQKLPWSRSRGQYTERHGRRWCSSILAEGCDRSWGSERRTRGGYLGGDINKNGRVCRWPQPATTPTERRRQQRRNCSGQATGPETTQTNRKEKMARDQKSSSTHTTTSHNVPSNGKQQSGAKRSTNPPPPFHALWARSRLARTSQTRANTSLLQSLASSAGALLRPEKRQAVSRARRPRARIPMASGWRAFFRSVWKGLMTLEGWCESSWGVRACAHVVAGALASSHSVVGSVVVGLAVWVSCAKRLGQGGKDSWKQVARVTAEVAILWYGHALPHGLGAGRPLRGNFGSGRAGDLLGAMWHFLGQGVFIRVVGASSRLVGVNVLEANGILLGMSCLGNAVAGSRMRCLTASSGGKPSEVCTYQLRGFFSRTKGIFGERPILSFAFDAADTLLALQGILTATEREVVRPNGIAAMAFRDFASQAANTLDAHSLGALGARNLMGMGFVRARVRMFGRPALSLGWTEKAHNMCMMGDPICGSLLQKLLDPTCVMLKGKGHFFDAYVACVGCLDNLGT